MNFLWGAFKPDTRERTKNSGLLLKTLVFKKAEALQEECFSQDLRPPPLFGQPHVLFILKIFLPKELIIDMLNVFVP